MFQFSQNCDAQQDYECVVYLTIHGNVILSRKTLFLRDNFIYHVKKTVLRDSITEKLSRKSAITLP